MDSRNRGFCKIFPITAGPPAGAQPWFFSYLSFFYSVLSIAILWYSAHEILSSLDFVNIVELGLLMTYIWLGESVVYVHMDAQNFQIS